MSTEVIAANAASPPQIELVPELAHRAAKLRPQESRGCEGILVAASAATRTAADLRTVTGPSLTQLVEQATQWPSDQRELEARVADYRFLVLDFSPEPDRALYVQIWSEPTSDVIMEVGPAQATDSTRKVLFESQAATLEGRGFQIGGGANNYRKTLPRPMINDLARIGAEMLALLTDVLGYEGTLDLSYKFHQGTHLKPSYITDGVTRCALASLLRVWGVNPMEPADEPTLLLAERHRFEFALHLFVPKSRPTATFREIHCHATCSVPNATVEGFLCGINSKPWLLKAYAEHPSRSDTCTVHLVYGINLSGGVTLRHLKSEFFEWLKTVRRFIAESKTLGRQSSTAESNDARCTTLH